MPDGPSRRGRAPHRFRSRDWMGDFSHEQCRASCAKKDDATPGAGSRAEAPGKTAGGEPASDYSQRTLRIAAMLGGFAACFTLVTYSAAVAESGWWSFGVMLWPAGLFAAGAGFGFLFAIPKVVQGAAAELPSGGGGADAAAAAPAQFYRQQVNSNLVEISDWLTKIIVGVSLVELKPILYRVKDFAKIVGQGFPGAETQFRSLALAVLFLFPAVGFLFGYLMTRLYVQPALFDVERPLSGYLNERINQAVQIASAAMSTVTTGIGKRPADATLTGSVVENAKDEQWRQDPHRNQFGGFNQANGRVLTAKIEPILGDDAEPCRVHLEVRSTDPARPLSGKVRLFLHPTFTNNEFDVDVKDGVAAFDIVSFGVFTVGAVADGGQTRLELNLSSVAGGTSAFYKN